MREWYCHINGQREGPVSPQELKSLAGSGKLKPADLVWTKGMEKWAQAGKVPGLYNLPSPQPQTHRFCPQCGKPVAPNSAFCGACGFALTGKPKQTVHKTATGKSPILAVLLTLFTWPGIGHIYNKDTQKGVKIILGTIALALLSSSFALL